MNVSITRRVFLASSAGAIAALAIVPAAALADDRPEPRGPVYGRTGPGGISPGSSDGPSRGPVTLLDGRTIEASHVTGWRIGAAKGVFLGPNPKGGWSILYAES